MLRRAGILVDRRTRRLTAVNLLQAQLGVRAGQVETRPWTWRPAARVDLGRAAITTLPLRLALRRGQVDLGEADKQASLLGRSAADRPGGRLAANGLTYTNFHVNALCSPTRMSLLTGRNQHQCSAATVVDTSTGYPGDTGVRPDSCATIGEIVHRWGYVTPTSASAMRCRRTR